MKSNFALRATGQCGETTRCGHVHMKINPEGDTCNIPGKPYNSMNSDFGGDLIKARFGHCASSAGTHVIGVLLADDQHRPILVDGKPVTALVTVTTKQKWIRRIGATRMPIIAAVRHGHQTLDSIH